MAQERLEESLAIHDAWRLSAITGTQRRMCSNPSATALKIWGRSTFNFKSKNGGGDFPDIFTGNADLVRCMAEQSITIKDKDCLVDYPSRLAGASHAPRTQRPGEQYRLIRAHDTQCFSYTENPKTPLPYDELYDLENDPASRINLLAPANITSKAIKLASTLSSELSDKLKSLRSQPLEPTPAERSYPALERADRIGPRFHLSRRMESLRPEPAKLTRQHSAGKISRQDRADDLSAAQRHRLGVILGFRR